VANNPNIITKVDYVYAEHTFNDRPGFCSWIFCNWLGILLSQQHNCSSAS